MAITLKNYYAFVGMHNAEVNKESLEKVKFLLLKSLENAQDNILYISSEQVTPETIVTFFNDEQNLSGVAEYSEIPKETLLSQFDWMKDLGNPSMLKTPLERATVPKEELLMLQRSLSATYGKDFVKEIKEISKDGFSLNLGIALSYVFIFDQEIKQQLGAFLLDEIKNFLKERTDNSWKYKGLEGYKKHFIFKGSFHKSYILAFEIDKGIATTVIDHLWSDYNFMNASKLDKQQLLNQFKVYPQNDYSQVKVDNMDVELNKMFFGTTKKQNSWRIYTAFIIIFLVLISIPIILSTKNAIENREIEEQIANTEIERQSKHKPGEEQYKQVMYVNKLFAGSSGYYLINEYDRISGNGNAYAVTKDLSQTLNQSGFSILVSNYNPKNTLLVMCFHKATLNSTNPWVILKPGETAQMKCLPDDTFITIIDPLMNRYGQVVSLASGVDLAFENEANYLAKFNLYTLSNKTVSAKDLPVITYKDNIETIGFNLDQTLFLNAQQSYNYQMGR
jgi:hypothetical protein